MTPATMLRLMWLASSALPVGGFSYSEGLEPAVEAGLVGSEAAAGDWLLQQLQLVLARADGPVVAQAWRAGDAQRIAELNAWVTASRETSEFRLRAEQMGRSLTEWLKYGEQAGDARIAQLENNIEQGTHQRTLQGLIDRGHVASVIQDSYQDFGAGQFIWRAGDPAMEGYLADSDSRRDGLVAAF